MTSFPAWPKSTSWPWPPCRVSAPPNPCSTVMSAGELPDPPISAPALIESAPAPPESESDPPPPKTRSFWSPPVNTSARALPTKVSPKVGAAPPLPGLVPLEGSAGEEKPKKASAVRSCAARESFASAPRMASSSMSLLHLLPTGVMTQVQPILKTLPKREFTTNRRASWRRTACDGAAGPPRSPEPIGSAALLPA